MKYPAEGGNQEFSKGADGERTLSAPLIFIRRLFMGAFDRVLSGIPGLDDLLDYIRMGDNVVWQVTDL